MSLPHVSPCSQQETGAPSRSTRTVNHRTSRPGREHHLIQSTHSPFCHFLAGPSLCLHPAGISTTQQMAPLAWKTFTLSVSTWWNSLPSVHILYHRYGGGVVAQWLALAFRSNKVSFLVPVCGLAFTMCLCRFLPPLWPVIQMALLYIFGPVEDCTLAQDPKDVYCIMKEWVKTGCEAQVHAHDKPNKAAIW